LVADFEISPIIKTKGRVILCKREKVASLVGYNLIAMQVPKLPKIAFLIDRLTTIANEQIAQSALALESAIDA